MTNKSRIIRKKFKERLKENSLVKLVGAHNAITAQMIENTGFDGVWASGLEISSSLGYPDANLLTMSEVLNITKEMARSCSIPIIADCDNGFGGINNVIRTVKDYEQSGITGICIEDKLFPKINSFIDTSHPLVSINEFCAKIIAATNTREDKNFIIIARTEALISGLSIKEALKRANAYLKAGADLVLIHSKSKGTKEIYSFLKDFHHPEKIVLVPTTYSSITYEELQNLNVKVVIHANQLIRNIIFNTEIFLNKLKEVKSIQDIEHEISDVSSIFHYQNMNDFTKKEQIYSELGRSISL